ncbi:unnamed protein product [Parnassius apollo]|uniref:(apollo) hypothetical protein n=1 Tax=Parnassius apollo TaxID=110799 RepID=A0A8S3XCC6_PARAO|nr:unnamed protein product [Parnassius apollo]
MVAVNNSNRDDCVRCYKPMVDDSIQKEGFSDDSPAEENITQHPSPDCSLNHLDFDCDNHFCPWFVDKDILPLPSVDSNITDLAHTPQENTPLFLLRSNTTSF